MVSMLPIHGFQALAHPLAQIRAAEEFYAQVDAFVADSWAEIFTDDPPDEQVLDAVSPSDMLDALATLGLRFEVAAAMVDPSKRTDEGFWSLRFQGGSLDALLHSWAYQVMNAVELDHRAFFEALRWTDLIFVPDSEHVASEAYQLLLTANPDEVHETEEQHEELAKRLYREDGTRRATNTKRGAGPRASKPAIIDRAATILRNAKVSLTPEELAHRMKHKNLASLTAALHQVVSYGKPQRLAGCLEKEGTGRYRWVEPA